MPAETIEVTKPSIADQYELGDTEHSPEFDEASGGEPTAAVPGEPGSLPSSPAPAVARDDKGRFQKPAEAAPAAEPTTPAHPIRLVRLAQELGLADEVINNYSTDHLDELVFQLHRQALRLAREHTRQETVQKSGDRTWSADGPAPVTAPPAKEEVSLGIEEDKYDPDLLGVIKKQAKRLADLEARLEGDSRAKANESLAETIDRVFVKHESVLGKGKGKELDPGSRDWHRRMAVLGIVDRDTSKSPIEAKIDRAVKLLYGEEGTAERAGSDAGGERISKSLKERQAQWEQGSLARPTHREGSAEPKGEKKAIQTAARIMKDRGMYDDEGMPEDAFPE